MKSEQKKEPLHRASHWFLRALVIALELLGLMVGLAALGMLFSALRGIDIAAVRIIGSLLLLAGELYVFWWIGAGKGRRDAGKSREWMKRQEAGIPQEEDRDCYQPMKMILGCVLAFALPLAAAVWIAVTEKPVDGEAEFRLVRDSIRVVLRLPCMPYINLFPDPSAQSLLLDRLIPLMLLGWPAAEMLGYACGPALQEKLEKEYRRAKRLAKKRAERNSVAKELLKGGGTVHYGQPEQASRKKNELI